MNFFTAQWLRITGGTTHTHTMLEIVDFVVVIVVVDVYNCLFLVLNTTVAIMYCNKYINNIPYIYIYVCVMKKFSSI